MICEVLNGRKLHPTVTASEWHLTPCMCYHVGLQLARLIKHLITNIALVLNFSDMHVNVYSEVTRMVEAFPANIAGVETLMLSSIRSSLIPLVISPLVAISLRIFFKPVTVMLRKVLLKVSGPSKQFSTNIATIKLVTCVNKLMLLETIWSSKLYSTVLTTKKLISRMYMHVALEVPRLSKLLPTYFTFVGLLTGMYEHMLV